MYDAGVGKKMQPLVAAGADSEVKSEAETAIANINLYGKGKGGKRRARRISDTYYIGST